MKRRTIDGALAMFMVAGLLLGACSSVTPRESASPTTAIKPTLHPTTSPSPTRQATVAAVASPTPGCQQDQGQLLETDYLSPLLSRAIPLWVYLPACYPQAEEALPVVYFLHGKPFDESHWVELGLVSTYENGLAQGRWRRGLLVMPRLPEPLFSSSDGGPGSYEQEFIEGVLAMVADRFQVTTSPSGRKLAGISRGGIWALEIGLNNPDQFGQVAALSPSLAVNYPRPAYDPLAMARSRARFPDDIFLLAGEQDWAEPKTTELAAILAESGAQVQLLIVPGDHQDPTWGQSLPQVLDFLLPAIQG